MRTHSGTPQIFYCLQKNPFYPQFRNPVVEFAHFCCRWEAIRMLYLPCPFYSEWHHEDAHSAETYRECGQVSLSTLWYCHRSQKWPWWVASRPCFMGQSSRIQLLDWSLKPHCQQKWEASPAYLSFTASYRSSPAKATFIYRDGEEMPLLWRRLSWALCSHSAPEDPQEREAFQVWPVRLLLQTGALSVERGAYVKRSRRW